MTPENAGSESTDANEGSPEPTMGTGATKRSPSARRRATTTPPAAAAAAASTAVGTAASTAKEAANTSAEVTKNAGVEITKALKDAAHAVIGFGVIGWNKTQVRRRELLKDLGAQRHQVETQLDGAKEQIATALRTIDTKVAPVRHDLEGQLDKVAERLPEQIRDLVQSARKIAHDTEQQLRQAVGAR